MTDERIARLEETVSVLREDNASLSTSVSHLSSNVEKLTEKLDELNNTMNRGRGALWVIISVSGLLGGLLSTGIRKVVGE